MLQQTLDLVPPSLALEAKLLGKDLRQLAPEALDTVMRILTHSTRVHGWTMKAGSRDSPFARLAQLLLHFSPQVRSSFPNSSHVWLAHGTHTHHRTRRTHAPHTRDTRSGSCVRPGVGASRGAATWPAR